MITGKETNTVFLSEWFKNEPNYRKTCEALTAVLDKHRIPYKYLKATKDIWCRDYMPIQKSKDDFIQFRYEPRYLKEQLQFQSDPKEVCAANGIRPIFSKINLDGGNVVNWSDRAIISDRVFDENPGYANKGKLIDELERLLEVEIIIIPQIKCDLTGHADGLLRFVDRNTVLGNHREEDYIYWKKGINKVLKAYNLDYLDVPFLNRKKVSRQDPAVWCYVNYLEIQDLIVLPISDAPNNRNQEAFDLFQSLFPDRKIETVHFDKVARDGGLANCCTWNILA